MSEYWTKERFKNIFITFGYMYVMLFGFFVFICWINNDLSNTTIIMSLQFALMTNLLVMCVGAFCAYITGGYKESDKDVTL